jgi:antitoxin component of MazEF toxin-antitoxin module
MMLSAFALVTALALPSWAQVKELPTTTETISGTIETIDKGKRAMNIKTADGKFVAVSVPKSVIRFDQLKVGDKVKATYNNNVIVRLKPAGEKAVDTAEKSTVRDQTGGKAVMVRRMTASIAEIDKSASSITFVGPNGWKYSRRVVDPAVFDQVKVGDRVDITWNTDLTVSVE